MVTRNFKRHWMKSFIYMLKYSKRVHGIILCLTFLSVHSFVHKYIEHREWYAAYSVPPTKADKVGILISASYHDNKDSLLSTLQQLSTLSDVLHKTLETGFEYEIYIGIDSVVNIAPYLKSNKSEMLGMNVQYVSTSSYSNSINELAQYALSKNFDYFAFIHFDAILKWKYWTKRAVMSLKGHCPSNFGIVVQSCEEQNQVGIVSRKHVDLFRYFFPPNLNISEATNWLINAYLPNHVTVMTAKGEIACSTKVNTSFSKLHKSSHEIVQNGVLQRGLSCVVSYSLYGSDKRYIDGAIKNYSLLKSIYPGWTMWLYHDSSVPSMILNSLCKQGHVRCFNMDESGIRSKMTWRFLVASAKNISKYVIRDIDSRLDFREKAAVNEWIHSGNLFHVMRDHPNHSHLRIFGGMWGGTGGALNSLNETVLRKNLNVKYWSDMEILDKHVWPILKWSVLQHDSFFCVRYGGKPFPTLRNGVEHVGNVYVDGKLRDADTKVFKKVKEPRECIPRTNLLEKL